MPRNFLVVDPDEGMPVFKGLASPARIEILKLLQTSGAQNINDLAATLSLPQSTVSTHIQVLEDSGLIETRSIKARKGNQKICTARYDEILIAFKNGTERLNNHDIEVAMPLGLYTSCHVSAPCGLCSQDGIIGLLDVPNTFLEPDRMKAGLLWFTRGYVEYQFPNNARLSQVDVEAVELSMELSSEVPGTSADWPSDISLTLNGVDIGTWTSPGDFGDRRGVYTPDWWKLSGSQYGKLKRWRIADDGTYVDGVRLSDVSVKDLDLSGHHSIRLRIAVQENAKHPGGINIFGRGFGNYDQDLVLRLQTG